MCVRWAGEEAEQGNQCIRSHPDLGKFSEIERNAWRKTACDPFSSHERMGPRSAGEACCVSSSIDFDLKSAGRWAGRRRWLRCSCGNLFIIKVWRRRRPPSLTSAPSSVPLPAPRLVAISVRVGAPSATVFESRRRPSSLLLRGRTRYGQFFHLQIVLTPIRVDIEQIDSGRGDGASAIWRRSGTFTLTTFSPDHRHSRVGLSFSASAPNLWLTLDALSVFRSRSPLNPLPPTDTVAGTRFRATLINSSCRTARALLAVGNH